MTADGGKINVQADNFFVRGELASYALAGTGQSSSIKIKVVGSTTFSEGGILLRSDLDGNVGNIDLETGTLHLKNEAYIHSLQVRDKVAISTFEQQIPSRFQVLTLV